MILTAFSLCIVSIAAPGDAQDFARVEAFPDVVLLQGPIDRHRLIVRGVDATGLTVDLTASAILTPANLEITRSEGTTLIPAGDGETSVTVVAGGKTISVIVRVTNCKAPVPATSFRLDVLPSLTRSGCNAGACHGSARGQDGFHLSLFGFDPASDFNAITREQPGRRLNLASPELSLLLQKAIGAVPHTGNKRMDPQDARYAAALQWLRDGAPDDAPGVPTVVSVEVYPQDIAIEIGGTQTLGVRATYSDGTDRDVTRLATLVSNNDYTAKVGDDAVVTAVNPGEAQILARFGGLALGTSVIIVPKGAALLADESAGGTPPNFIDKHVADKLRRLRVPVSGLCTDTEYLRRITLDLTGQLPTADEYDRFVADQNPAKRAQLADALMGRKEFAEIWVMKWCERLGIRSNPEVSPKATLLYATWFQQRLASGAPIDQVVREIIASEGGTFDTPATNFYQLERDTLKLSENVAQAFLGTRLQCAQCHNHPFDRWTMNDYYGLAAFFTQVARKPGEDPRETIVFNSGNGEMKHPVGGRVVKPRFLGGPDAPDGRDRRAVLAEWITSDSNTMFPRNIANFVWAHFFGRGIVDPVDDVRASNPPVNAALLDALAKRLVECKYDIKPLVRDICASRAYQRSTHVVPGNEKDDRNFSHANVRRIRAEFLLDCISQATGTKDKFDGLPLGSRAVQIADGTTSNYFLTTFGRAKRDTVCTCEVVMEPSLSQALNLINGETVNDKLKQSGLIDGLLKAGKSPTEILERLFIVCLARKPSPDETTSLLARVAEAGDPRTGLDDAFWAILNSREFIFNH